MNSNRKLMLAGLVLVLSALALAASGFSEQEGQVVVREGHKTYVWHMKSGSNEPKALTTYGIDQGKLVRRHYELEEKTQK